MAPLFDTSEATVNGWSFSCESSHISGNPGLLALSRELADPYVPAGEAAVHPFCVHGSSRSLKPCMCGSALVMGINMHRRRRCSV